MSDNRASLPPDLLGPPSPAMLGAAAPSPQQPITALVSPTVPSLGGASIPSLGTPLASASASAASAAPSAAPRAVTDILAQNVPADRGFDQMWTTISTPGPQTESGGRDVPNYRYDMGHTASGYGQITDQNWKAVAPRLGIDVQRYPTAMSAPPDYQKAVGKLMYRMQGPAPWDAAHGGPLPPGGIGNPNDPSSPQALRTAAFDALQAASAQSLKNRVELAEQLKNESLVLIKAATEAPPNSAERQKLLIQAQEQLKQATQHYQYLADHPPTEQPSTALTGFGALMLGLVALAGRHAEQPLTASLGAMGAGLQAMNKGDMDTFKQRLDVWKYQSDMGLNIAKLQQENITNILNDSNTAWQQKQQQLSTLFKAAGLQIEAAKLENDPEAPYKYAEALGQLLHNAELDQFKMWSAGSNIIKQQNYADAVNAGKQQWYAAHPGQNEIPPVEMSKIENAAAAESGITPTGRSAYALFSQGYKQTHPEATEEDSYRAFRREGAIESAFGSGVMGRNLVSLNTVADHLSLLKEYATALNNKDIPRANQLLNQFATETGKPEVTNFETARDIAADEVIRLLTTTGGTEADRQGMQSRFSAAASPEQLMGAIDVAGRFVSGRLTAMEQQYAGNDAQRKSEFEGEMLTPGARDWFTGGARSTAPPSYSHTATGPNGAKVYSNDGVTWFNADGSPYKAQ